MAGRKGRSGRKPIPIEVHLAKGTYRPDRHGPRPALAAPSTAPAAAVPVELYVGLDAAGLTLVQQHVEALEDDWTPRDLALLRQAAEARDRQAALAAIIRREGVTVGGEPHPCLRAERQAAALVVTALRALDIRPAPAVAAGRRVG